MKTVAVVSSKGGTGKTTLTLHLAVSAVQCKKRVLIIDMDPQRSAWSWRQVRKTPAPDVVAVQPGRLASFQFGAASQYYDLILIDTPPTAGPLTAEAVAGADLALIVTRPNALDVWAVRWASDLVRDARRPGLFVINQAPPRRQDKEQPAVIAAYDQLLGYGHPVSTIGLRSRVAYSAFVAQGSVAQEADPESAAAVEIGQLFDQVSKFIWREAAPRMIVRRRSVRRTLWDKLGWGRFVPRRN